MGNRTQYTKITPLPINVPRQLALDMLHSHTEVIKLNPLVTGVKSIEAPRNAASDEFFSQWYEIAEIITWGFGLKKKISFKGVFHDQPWGLQSHVYAPMGVDMRNKYTIGGNQPGEPREARELGLNTPADGLYLREDVEIICAVPLTMSFVKKEAKAATGIMVDRLTRKAELLDEGKLHAMFENGRLRTSKPNQEPTFTDRPMPSPRHTNGFGLAPDSPVPGASSPALNSTGLFSPPTDEKGYGRYHDIMARRESSKRNSYVPQYQQHSYNGTQSARPGADLNNVPEDYIAEVPGSFYHPGTGDHMLYPPPLKAQNGSQQSFRSELPGDFQYSGAPHFQPQQQPHSSDHRPNYQAYQTPPQPQPNHHQSSISLDQKYHLANPDTTHPAYRSSPHNTQQQQQQRNLSVTSSAYSEDPQTATSSSRHSSTFNTSSDGGGSSTLDSRFSHMSLGSSPYSTPDPSTGRFPSREPSGASGQGLGIGMGKGAGGGGVVSKCPVCLMFEGDEAAVGHHVSVAHGFT